MMIKKWWMVFCGILLVQWALAQAPEGYYAATKGTAGRTLKTAMHQVVKDHVERSYSQLWEDFRKTDVREDGKVWDMYSKVTNYDFGKPAQGANYKKEGDSYNREHSFPKSWFNDGKPMYTDLFHVYSTDGYVNNRRSNYPFGETANPTYTSAEGWSRLGPSSLPGYSGVVFEPNDEYKGDFARSYFYMATCYEDQIEHWDSKMLNHTDYPAFSDWALELLLRWSKEDPVSEKEINRNNAVYGIQQNRNPFIDYPGLEDWIWGSRCDLAFDPDHYDPNQPVEPQPQDSVLVAPVFSLPSGMVAKGSVVTISCDAPGAFIYYTLNGGSLQTGFAPVQLTINETVEVEAYAMRGEQRSETVKAVYQVADAPGQESQVFVRVTDPSELQVNARYLMVCESHHCALSQSQSDYRGVADVTIVDDKIDLQSAASPSPCVLILGQTAGGYTWYDTASRTYLALTSNKNKLHSVQEVTDEAGWWTVDIAGDATVIANVRYPQRSIQYNASAPRFATYTSGQQAVTLFRETSISGIVYPEMKDRTVDVYSLDGRLLRDDIAVEKAVKGLPKGIYVVGGMKIIVR